jgi:hypothetical protein
VIHIDLNEVNDAKMEPPNHVLKLRKNIKRLQINQDNAKKKDGLHESALSFLRREYSDFGIARRQFPDFGQQTISEPGEHGGATSQNDLAEQSAANV